MITPCYRIVVVWLDWLELATTMPALRLEQSVMAGAGHNEVQPPGKPEVRLPVFGKACRTVAPEGYRRKPRSPPSSQGRFEALQRA